MENKFRWILVIVLTLTTVSLIVRSVKLAEESKQRYGYDILGRIIGRTEFIAPEEGVFTHATVRQGGKIVFLHYRLPDGSETEVKFMFEGDRVHCITCGW